MSSFHHLEWLIPQEFWVTKFYCVVSMTNNSDFEGHLIMKSNQELYLRCSVYLLLHTQNNNSKKKKNLSKFNGVTHPFYYAYNSNKIDHIPTPWWLGSGKFGSSDWIYLGHLNKGTYINDLFYQPHCSVPFHILSPGARKSKMAS